MSNLIPVSIKNQKVLTTKQLSEVYETSEKNISNNFNNNIEHFEEGKHYYLLQGESLREFKRNSYEIGIAPSVNKLYLWTERGANRHCKILDTDKAWEQFDNLEETYFRVKEGQPNIEGLSPQLQTLINLELGQKKLEEKIETVREENKNEIQAMRDVITLDSNGWRKETTLIINKIAKKLGGFAEINVLKKEIYKLLNGRLGVDVNRRLLEKQKRMALEGVCKSKINKVNVLDVIEEDKKLIDGYVNIVRQYAIKYGVA
ncbi:ORF6N domain-containing protein [Clostridium baratii]